MDSCAGYDCGLTHQALSDSSMNFIKQIRLEEISERIQNEKRMETLRNEIKDKELEPTGGLRKWCFKAQEVRTCEGYADT
jgi:hypothetical protein